MRGDDEQSGHLFSYLSPEQRVPANHPLRTVRSMTDEAVPRQYSENRWRTCVRFNKRGEDNVGSPAVWII